VDKKLAIPAYLASVASTLTLQDQILALCPSANDVSFEDYLSRWSSAFGAPAVPWPSKLSVWDRPGLQVAQVEASFADATQKARYLASVAPHSGDWLLALPITSCGLRLDDEAVRVAIGARLGLSYTQVQLWSGGGWHWMLRLATLWHWCVKMPQAEWPDIMPWMTPSAQLSSLLEFQPPKSRQVFAHGMVKGQMVFP